MKLVQASNRESWDEYVMNHRSGHPLQLWAWGELKRLGGWRADRLFLKDDNDEIQGAVQVLFWPIPKTHRFIAYVPRGPVCDGLEHCAHKLLSELTNYAKQNRALYLRIEPAWTMIDLPKKWKRSRDHILLPETFTIDLKKTEDELLASMRSKTRQYIRKAEQEGVKVVESKEEAAIWDFWRIYSETAKRAKFGIHGQQYYEVLRAEFGDRGRLFFAEINGRPEACLWLVEGGKVAFELYGGITAAGSEAKANYLLKWRAISAMKAAGMELYDFNGQFHEGVGQFKAGFGPDDTRYVGTFDYPFNATLYRAWRAVWPLAKRVGRRLKVNA